MGGAEAALWDVEASVFELGLHDLICRDCLGNSSI